jgi:hypothetical protein
VKYLLARFILLLHELVDVLEGLRIHELSQGFLPALQLVLELVVGKEEVALHGYYI